MSAVILLIIGVLLMILEVLFLDFTLFFFGLGFTAVAIISFFVKISWQVQILCAFVLALVLLFMLKKPIKMYFRKSGEEFNQEFLNETGIGEINNKMIYYKGTFWKSDEISDMKDGDKVEVLGVKNGKIIIKKN